MSDARDALEHQIKMFKRVRIEALGRVNRLRKRAAKRKRNRYNSGPDPAIVTPPQERKQRKPKGKLSNE